MLLVTLQETFGAMAKTEKIAFILEQVCLVQRPVDACVLHTRHLCASFQRCHL